MRHILIVCTANVCRSPMLAGLLRQHIKTKKPVPGWTVESAGTWGQTGLPAAEHAVAAMQQRGIDLRRHKSRIVSKELVQRADLILTVEANHKEALQIEFPQKKERIFLISELIEEKFDIEDPMGQPLDAFERTAREMEMIIIQGFSKIQELLGKRD